MKNLKPTTETRVNAKLKATAKALSAKAAPSKKSEQVGVTDQIETTFSLVNETKGALRYEETGFQKDNMDATAIGTLYLRKKFFSTPYPQTIRVTVQDVTE